MSNEQLRDDFVENDIPDSVNRQRCSQCNVENSSEYRYCPNCGKALILSWESVQEYIIANLPQHISKVLETNYKNQTVVEIETAMLISERILKWSKLAATVLGIPLLIISGFVSFYRNKIVCRSFFNAEEHERTRTTGKKRYGSV